MKNIHLLPTDKPSRLLQSLKVIELLDKEWLSPIGNVNRNICITNDEEIKEGDYRYNTLHPNEGIFKVENQEDLNYVLRRKQYKKIILTTDQDLIKDGVQEIPEYFLIHYIMGNNPIEYVEIKEHLESIDTMKINYELIIPKQEPKTVFNQLEVGKEYKQEVFELGEEPKQSIIKTKEDAKIFIEALENIPEPNEKLKKAFKDFHKQETLEEVRVIKRTELYKSILSIVKQIPRKEVEEDAMDAPSCAYELEQLFLKWQQEQDKNKFSEEDIKDYAEYYNAVANPKTPKDYFTKSI